MVHKQCVLLLSMLELIIDEAAHESARGLSVPCGAFEHCIKHITLAGNHKQGRGMSLSADSNIGHAVLSRNIFQEVAEDPRQVHNVILLSQGYRMLEELYACVSQFYDGKLKAYSGAGNIDKPLQNTAEACWKSRLRDSFAGSVRQVAIDVTSEGTIKHAQLNGTTTKLNEEEAKVVAWTVKDMLLFTPPANTLGMYYRPFTPADFVVVTPYTGQVLEIRKHLRLSGGHVFVNTEGVLVCTTSHSQGKEALMTFISLVVNIGKTRAEPDDKVPVSFMADDHNINVAFSRQRIGRHIVGGLTCLTQMKYDRHTLASRHAKFFNHLKGLCESDSIVTSEEWDFAMRNKRKPDPAVDGICQALAFSRTMEKPHSTSGLNRPGLVIPPPPASGPFHNITHAH
ncbi:hypothetical protein P153DRAFT_355467 [Dothidotthia symphoricarpi CBS 119687]|uniref:DNA2/NAM7 helicase-like C-terminal domain-containing protein n=1 Tax=Dothidotthia symphoricarpi CBS 119687 TaxID=1392245 RepID=A0A6A6AIF5_9PLEO|nr:uncharacterized protein P153DRAFT_355467 [Dothidotthia symphoricarpi CBS 119687]KAF2131739.1 hypothetical protein P153DRAFT_355467 [Dothidotthia symphoricarpi CBS 119687]